MRYVNEHLVEIEERICSHLLWKGCNDCFATEKEMLSSRGDHETESLRYMQNEASDPTEHGCGAFQPILSTSQHFLFSCSWMINFLPWMCVWGTRTFWAALPRGGGPVISIGQKGITLHKFVTCLTKSLSPLLALIEQEAMLWNLRQEITSSLWPTATRNKGGCQLTASKKLRPSTRLRAGNGMLSLEIDSSQLSTWMTNQPWPTPGLQPCWEHFFP